MSSSNAHKYAEVIKLVECLVYQLNIRNESCLYMTQVALMPRLYCKRLLIPY